MKRTRTHITTIAIMALFGAFASDKVTSTYQDNREIISVEEGTVMSMTDAVLRNSVSELGEIKVEEVCEQLEIPNIPVKPKLKPSIYDLPYSVTGKCYNWKQLWINTGVLGGAYVGTLLVLECLPEDATTWNRAEIRNTPLFTRWKENVLEKGPEWDHDKVIFNYVLHPYAGAVYYMSARSCGFNAWQSLLYSALISTVGWEFGIEAFMERPSIQDIFVTPLVGSLIGEGFYKVKRHIVDNGYELWGSPVMGNVVAFLVDPVNEVVGLFGGNKAREASKRKGASLNSTPVFTAGNGSLAYGLSISYTF